MTTACVATDFRHNAVMQPVGKQAEKPFCTFSRVVEGPKFFTAAYKRCDRLHFFKTKQMTGHTDSFTIC
jgi:hypothetical protein